MNDDRKPESESTNTTSAEDDRTGWTAGDLLAERFTKEGLVNWRAMTWSGGEGEDEESGR